MMKSLIVRTATQKDSRDIFEWRNDPITRDVSRNSAPVQWESHAPWFEAALSNPERVLLICQNAQDEKIGMIRFDLSLDEERQAEISINLNPDMRGKGYAKPCLRIALSYFQEAHSDYQRIIAEIKACNTGSIASFEGAGFQKISEESDYIRYALDLLSLKE